MEQQTQYNKAILLVTPAQSTTLTTAKVHQMMSTKEHIILNLIQVIRYKTEVIVAWKRRFDVLVLESQSSNEKLEDVLNEISTMLNECAEEKVFIYIVNKQVNTEHIIELRRLLKEKLTQVYDDWKFTDLVTDSVKYLLEERVNFQGTELQFKNLVKESDFNILNTLDCDTISLLLANEKHSIGTPIENPPEYYIERTL
jgi:hypothetical protein